MTEQLRAAVFGHTGRGDYGHGHDLSLGLHPEVRIVAIADPDSVGRQQALGRTGAQRGYADYRELLAQETPDLVSIASRHVAGHVDQLMACAQHGVQGVLCEKPMVASLVEADKVLSACEEAGTQIVVAQRRASRYEIHAYELMGQGQIGDIVEMRGRGKGDQRTGGEDLAVLGTHILDSMRWFAQSDPRWAVGHVVQNGRPVRRTDKRAGNEGIGPIAGNALTGLFMFAGGVPATFTSYAVESNGDPDRHASWFGYEVYGTRGAFSIRNSPGGLLYYYPHGMCAPNDEIGWERILLSDWEFHPTGRPHTGTEKMLLSNRIMVDELVAAVREGKAITRACTGYDARWSLEMIMAIHESHLQDRKVTFPLSRRHNPYDDLPV